MAYRIPIEAESARIGSIIEVVSGLDAIGNPLPEMVNQIVGDHVVDIQDVAPDERFNSEKMNIDVSHVVYPERDVTLEAAVEIINHFYLIEGQRYRITWINDLGSEIVYFKVLHQDFGRSQAS